VASSRVTRILITGGDGILASALKAYFPLADYYGRQTCDVTRPEQVRMAFQNTKPELVIHCAAQTSHNAEPFSYVQANIQGTANVAAQAKKTGARSLLSTPMQHPSMQESVLYELLETLWWYGEAGTLDSNSATPQPTHTVQSSLLIEPRTTWQYSQLQTTPAPSISPGPVDRFLKLR
jgi:hypothetical protein